MKVLYWYHQCGYVKQAKKCLYCLAVFAVYHEQKYTVSQHLKIGRYGHAIVCKLQYYASAYTGACLKFVTWTDKSLCLMGCSIFPLLLLSSSLDSLGHSVPPVQYIYVRGCGCPAVMAQWQSTSGSSQRRPGFDYWWLPAFSLSSIFAS